MNKTFRIKLIVSVAEVPRFRGIELRRAELREEKLHLLQTKLLITLLNEIYNNQITAISVSVVL